LIISASHQWEAVEIKLRAQRRIGEISRELETGKPGPKNELLPTGGMKLKTEVLKEAGLTTSTA